MHRLTAPAKPDDVSSGVVAFGDLMISWVPSVLPPRTWTQAQSEWAIELLRACPDGPVLELCAGSGQIGLLTVAKTGRPLVAVDINPEAARCTRENAAAAGLGHLVEIRCSSLESALAEHETFPLIIADPPWVPHDELSRYPQSPSLAIDGGDDGLHLARLCVRVIDRHLRTDGRALIQLGSADQVRQLAGEFSAHGLGLTVTEHRVYPRGHLVLLERPSVASRAA